MLFRWLYRCTIVIIVLLTFAIVSRINTSHEREEHALQIAVNAESKIQEVEAKAIQVETTYAKEHQ